MLIGQTPGRMPTLPDSFGLVRLLSLLQSASMLTHVVQAGMQRASEWGIAGGIGYNRQPVASSIQQFTNDFESGPGSHP